MPETETQVQGEPAESAPITVEWGWVGKFTSDWAVLTTLDPYLSDAGKAYMLLLPTEERSALARWWLCNRPVTKWELDELAMAARRKRSAKHWWQRW